MSRVHQASLLLAILLLAAGSARVTVGQGIKDTVKETFRVRPGGTLHLDLDRGNIDVRARSGDAVVVEMERIVPGGGRAEAERVLENHTYDLEQRGNDVHIQSRFEREDSRVWGRWRGGEQFKMNVTVYVPERYSVDFTSGAGNIAVADVDGQVRGRTGAGNIEITEVGGPVRVSSGSGNVELRGTTGRVEVNTGAGNVELADVWGEAEVTTGAGNIEAFITRQPQGTSRLESGAGNVTVYLANRVGVDVDASTGVGSAQTDFPLTVEGKWISKSFEGAVQGGGPALRLRTGVGNVALLKR